MATEFKEAREQAGLTVNEAAKLLELNPVTLRRFEMDPHKSTARKPPRLLLKVLNWYSEGKPPSLEDTVSVSEPSAKHILKDASKRLHVKLNKNY